MLQTAARMASDLSASEHDPTHPLSIMNFATSASGKGAVPRWVTRLEVGLQPIDQFVSTINAVFCSFRLYKPT